MPNLLRISSLIPAPLDAVPVGQQQLPGGNGSDWEPGVNFRGSYKERRETKIHLHLSLHGKGGREVINAVTNYCAKN